MCTILLIATDIIELQAIDTTLVKLLRYYKILVCVGCPVQRPQIIVIIACMEREIQVNII